MPVAGAEVEGEDLEWPLGALLQTRSHLGEELDWGYCCDFALCVFGVIISSKSETGPVPLEPLGVAFVL